MRSVKINNNVDIEAFSVRAFPEFLSGAVLSCVLSLQSSFIGNNVVEIDDDS